jgi:hypothetical protein
MYIEFWDIVGIRDPEKNKSSRIRIPDLWRRKAPDPSTLGISIFSPFTFLLAIPAPHI